ncbi:FAD-dependent 5-carboxymethylaminomethyl-2-thiouridine(34) oxidoreductase MnmC [Halomonadaceae bacterium KBTZ08]
MTHSDAIPPSPGVIIVGAGVAGSLTARLLAEAGIKVAIMDPTLPSPLNQQRRGALYMKPAVDYNPETRFAHQAFGAASRFYSRLQGEHPDINFWFPTGTLALAWSEREQERQDKLLARNHWDPAFLEPVTAREACEICGLDVTASGLWFPGGGHMRVDALRQAALTHPLIKTHHLQVEPDRIQASAQGWQLPLPEGERLEAQTLVIAAGAGAPAWAPELPLGRIRGQLTTFPCTGPGPAVAVSGAGYALPPYEGRVCVGATFDRDSDNAGPDSNSDRDNLNNLARWLPALAQQLEGAENAGHWVGFRSTTPDHMPVAGALKDHYIVAGLGGKGLMYAPLIAEHLTAMIQAKPSPLAPELSQRLTPERFHKG